MHIAQLVHLAEANEERNGWVGAKLLAGVDGDETKAGNLELDGEDLPCERELKV